MTLIFAVAALSALVGLAAVWLRLRAVEKTVGHLERTHGSSEGVKAAGGRPLPPFTLSGETTTTREVVTENLIVLGYRTLVFDMTNQSNAHNTISRDITVQPPPGTTLVVPWLTGFALTFGKLSLSSNGTVSSVSVEDHHLGLAAVGIYVAGFGYDSVTLRVNAVLTDKNGDDKWSGVAYAAALFLGPHP